MIHFNSQYSVRVCCRLYFLNFFFFFFFLILYIYIYLPFKCGNIPLKLNPATHLAILYADRRDRRKSPGVPGAAIAIFVDRRIKSPISSMSDNDD